LQKKEAVYSKGKPDPPLFDSSPAFLYFLLFLFILSKIPSPVADAPGSPMIYLLSGLSDPANLVQKKLPEES
jgi:hypothetical protein